MEEVPWKIPRHSGCESLSSYFFNDHYSYVLKGVNLHCICKMVYSPVLDEQRYCIKCKSWFHMTCLENTKSVRHVSGPLGKQLVNMPIVRGWFCDPPQKWMTVGNRKRVEKAKKVYKVGTSQDWGDLLDEDYVTLSTTTSSESFRYSYTCPTCFEDI
jgi:hypothetical protein